MSEYWLDPPREHLVRWASNRWPSSKDRFEKMRVRQLRAIWHAFNKERCGL